MQINFFKKLKIFSLRSNRMGVFIIQSKRLMGLDIGGLQINLMGDFMV